MEKKYFGQGCKYIMEYWSDSIMDGMLTQRTPTLVYCKHPKNKKDVEGNCCKLSCPLLKENKEE